MHLLKSGWSTLKCIYTNYRGTSLLKPIRSFKVRDDCIIMSLKLKEMWKVRKDFKVAFSSNMLLSSWLIFLLFRRRLCFVLKNQKGSIMAYMFFMFNENEFKNNYIHASELFAASGFLNTGVGAIIESEVLHYLQVESSLNGVMARVTITNKNAYKLIEYNGFEVLSKYFDSKINQHRAYVLKKFER